MVHKGGYLLANGILDDLTELQYHAVPHIVATIASLENGTYKGGHKADNDVMTVEELTELRLNGKAPTRSQDNSKYYTEPTDCKEWINCKPFNPN